MAVTCRAWIRQVLLRVGHMDTDSEVLETGYRLFSAYEVLPQRRIWAITKADRYKTTRLSPEEH